jgi:hypothetical protein
MCRPSGFMYVTATRIARSAARRSSPRAPSGPWKRAQATRFSQTEIGV